jgi:UDP-N-acetylglucosamine 2-epimerase (non-hydrolysing)
LQPDWVLVQGDTTTAMAAALLAYYHRARVGHVEAGLRTGDKWQPFPEEINRRVAGVVADLHFAPTEWARGNLIREGVPDEQVLVTGNTVIDALRSVASQPPTPEVLELLKRLDLQAGSSTRLVLITAHRRESFGQPFEAICTALRILAETYPTIRFAYPVHLNPNVQEPVRRILSDIPNLTLLPPLDYLPFVHLVKRAALILTDSGGLQEEAPGLGVPVLVLREVTERPEGVEAGTVRLVGADTGRILAEARRLLDDPEAHAQMAHAANPYGDGHAAERIARAIVGSPNR